MHFQKRELEINVGENEEQFFFSAPTHVSIEPQFDMIGVRKYEVAVLYKRAVNKLKIAELEKNDESVKKW